MQKKTGEGMCGQADIGSPLASAAGELIGIASWNNGCGKVSPDVFTKVYHHLDWIHATILGLKIPSC